MVSLQNFLKQITISLIFLSTNYVVRATTIMIDPAGHAKHTGRQLHQGYERAETYKCAEALKSALEQRFDNVRVILTRAPGDEIVPLQNASFANRLNVDFFVRLNFYKEDTQKPQISLYHLVFDPIVDGAKRMSDSTNFIPIHQAHYANIHQSTTIATKMKYQLSQPDYLKLFDVQGVNGLPIKPLVGIQAPALTIEIGLLSDDQWNITVEPLIASFAIVLGLAPRSILTIVPN